VSDPASSRPVGPCSYCGEEHEQEPEHVVPQAIFVNGNQSTIIIPACHRCNNQKSAGEDDLRDYLIITVGVHGHEDILPLMTVMAESAGKGFSKIGKSATQERKPVLQRTETGVDVPVFEVPNHDPKPMLRTLRYIVRGLYFQENGRPWLPDQPLTFHLVLPEDLEETLDLLRRVGPLNFSAPMGQDVFKYALITQPEHPDVTVWAMVFFGKVLGLGITGIPEPEEERDEPTFEELIRGKGRRERRLRGIVERGIVIAPPEDILGFLHYHEEMKRRGLGN
jgi:hypothetical protein